MPDRLRRTLGVAWRTWRALGRDDARARAALEAYVLDEVVLRPIVFEDGRGLRYVLRPGENALAYLEHDGNYEVAETRFCERFLAAGMTAVDAGAHIGLYTLLFARLVGETGRVHAFEPSPATFARLLESLALNRADNVVAEQAALFSAPGTVTLNLFRDELAAWHSLASPELPDPDVPYATVTPTSSVAVPAVTLDGYVAEHGLAAIDLLKLDVEGAEADVLAGARETLAAGTVRAVLFEVSMPQTRALGHEPGASFDLLHAAGFAVHALEPDGSVGDRVSAPSARYGNYVALPDAEAPRTR